MDDKYQKRVFYLFVYITVDVLSSVTDDDE